MINFLRGVVLKILYPALMLAGAFYKSRKEGFQVFVIKLNNRLVRTGCYRASTLLLLLPHCLQTTECEVRITHNILNCKRCGKCEIRDLIKISEDNKLRLFVATGGTIARRVVKEVRPDAIIAVACERDLSSGLVDIFPLPVIGILNERPFGPCVNTRVDLAKVREAIAFFAGQATD